MRRAAKKAKEKISCKTSDTIPSTTPKKEKETQEIEMLKLSTTTEAGIGTNNGIGVKPPDSASPDEGRLWKGRPAWTLNPQNGSLAKTTTVYFSDDHEQAKHQQQGGVLGSIENENSRLGFASNNTSRPPSQVPASLSRALANGKGGTPELQNLNGSFRREPEPQDLVQQQQPPPPGSYQDDDTGPSPKILMMTVTALKESLNNFAKSFISHMKKNPDGSKNLEETIRNGAGMEVHRANHWKFLVQAYICRLLFEDFDESNYGIQDTQESSKIDCFQDFLTHRDKADTISRLLANEGKLSFLDRFCFQKFKSIVQDTGMEQTFFGDTKHSEEIRAECHPTTEFYRSFLKVVVSVWLLHRLTLSFEQRTKILRFKTGSGFERKFMEPVVPGSCDEDNDENDCNLVVGFMVLPGFQVSESIVKSEVYIVSRNRQTHVRQSPTSPPHSSTPCGDIAGNRIVEDHPAQDSSILPLECEGYQSPSPRSLEHTNESDYLLGDAQTGKASPHSILASKKKVPDRTYSAPHHYSMQRDSEQSSVGGFALVNSVPAHMAERQSPKIPANNSTPYAVAEKRIVEDRQAGDSPKMGLEGCEPPSPRSSEQTTDSDYLLTDAQQGKSLPRSTIANSTFSAPPRLKVSQQSPREDVHNLDGDTDLSNHPNQPKISRGPKSPWRRVSNYLQPTFASSQRSKASTRRNSL